MYAPKRASHKRRRYGRRRFKRRNRDIGTSNNHVLHSSLNKPRSSLISKRRWRNALWNFTRCQTHYTATGTYSTSISSPASLDTYQLKTFKAFDDFTAVANWHNPDGPEPGSLNGRIIMRGGAESMTLSTEADECMDMLVQLVWIKPGGARLSDAAAISKSTAMQPWISSADRVNEETRLLKQWKFVLERGAGNVTLTHKARIKAYDTVQFANNADCVFWYVYVGNTVTNTASAVTMIKNWSCSLCPDHVMS